MTEKQKWSYLWRYLVARSTLNESQAKLVASLAIEWLGKRAQGSDHGG